MQDRTGSDSLRTMPVGSNFRVRANAGGVPPFLRAIKPGYGCKRRPLQVEQHERQGQAMPSRAAAPAVDPPATFVHRDFASEPSLAQSPAPLGFPACQHESCSAMRR